MSKPSSSLMGYFCSYTPIEIILAAGFNPIRISGHSNPIEQADSYMHPNLCQYVKACLDVALSGGYDDLDGFVFVNSCDTMRRLHDVWKKNIKGKFTYIMDLPVGRSQTEFDYFKNEILKLKNALEDFTKNTISDKTIKAEIAKLSESRTLYHKLNEFRTIKPPLMSGFELIKHVDEFNSSNLEKWNKQSKNIIRSIETLKRHLTEEKPRIMLSGSPIHEPEIIKFIEDCGFSIVHEDICTGSRFFDIEIVDTGDLFMDLSKAYLKKPPCARMMLIEERIKEMLEIVEKFKVDGIIYYSLKFCDPTLYDVPRLKKILTEKGIKILFIEGDCTLGSFGQLKTRIEAFAEMLSNKR